jgi:hypothetical protein
LWQEYESSDTERVVRLAVGRASLGVIDEE